MFNKKLYQNKEWLYNKYWGEILSEIKIAKLCKTTRRAIRYWMDKFEIKRRSYSEVNHLRQANHCNLSKEAIEWFNGESLGDGCFCSQSSYSARFVYGSKYEKYVEYISSKLTFFGIKRSGKIYKQYHKNSDCSDYYYASCFYVELLPVYKKWYPNGKKIVPRDIELTPLTCRQWYIGDGCLKKPKKQKPHIKLATCGFSIPDVEWLVKKLINLGFKATRQSFDNVIHISSYSTKTFLDYIGKCPVKCYQYKWEY